MGYNGQLGMLVIQSYDRSITGKSLPFCHLLEQNVCMNSNTWVHVKIEKFSPFLVL